MISTAEENREKQDESPDQMQDRRKIKRQDRKEGEDLRLKEPLLLLNMDDSSGRVSC